MYKFVILDRNELELGIKKESEEHGMDLKTARKTAIDHLKENPRYYSIAQGVGLEDEQIAETSHMDKKSRLKKVPSRLTKLKRTKGPYTVVGTSLPGPTGAGIGY